MLAKLAAREQVETYVIGGYVRDLLLYGDNASAKDIDIVVVGSGIEMAEKVKEINPWRGSPDRFQELRNSHAEMGPNRNGICGCKKRVLPK